MALERDGLREDLVEAGKVHARLVAEFDASKKGSSASDDLLESLTKELAKIKVWCLDIVCSSIWISIAFFFFAGLSRQDCKRAR